MQFKRLLIQKHGVFHGNKPHDLEVITYQGQPFFSFIIKATMTFLKKLQQERNTHSDPPLGLFDDASLFSSASIASMHSSIRASSSSLCIT
jgi:hypothetical protein